MALLLGLAPALAGHGGHWHVEGPVNVTTGGTLGTDDVLSLAISGDGRIIAFTTADGSLVPNDTNGERDVFVHDRDTGITEIVSVDNEGQPSSTRASGGNGIAVSADGRFVAFASQAALVPDAPQAVYVRDRLLGTTEVVSRDAVGNPVLGRSPSISADGRYVAYDSNDHRIAGVFVDIFVYDRATQTTARVVQDGSSSDPQLSGNGRFLVYWSSGESGDTNASSDLFRLDLVTGTTVLVSKTMSGEQASGEINVSNVVSHDGRFVVFDSVAPDIVTGDDNGTRDVFVFDADTGSVERVSRGSGPESGGTAGAISDDGQFVAFSSSAALSPGDVNGEFDVFVHDRAIGTLELASVSPSGQPGNGDSFHPAIDRDGSVVVMFSEATNLAGLGGNGTVRDALVAVRSAAPAPARYVALGDSFSSGEGVEPFEAFTDVAPSSAPPEHWNLCHRSAGAYPWVVAADIGVPMSLEHWACSGAIVDDLFESRTVVDRCTSDGCPEDPPWNDPGLATGNATRLSYLGRLDGRVDLVTLTIGGNDVGFSNVLHSCIVLPGDLCSTALNRDVNARILELHQEKLPTLFARLRVSAGTARVLVLGYPRLFPTDPSYCPVLSTELSLSASEQRWANSKGELLNSIIRRSAETAGFEYVDVWEAFDGGELCGSGGHVQDGWPAGRYLNGLRLATPRQSFHPSLQGQQRLGRMVLDHLGVAPLEAPGDVFDIGLGEVAQSTASISAGLQQVTFTTNWPGSDVGLTLTSPSGRRIDRSTGTADVAAFHGPTYEVLTITNPEPGAWTASLHALDVPPGGTEVRLRVSEIPKEAATGTQVGLVDPAQGQWHLRNTAGQVTSFFFGNPGDVPVMGDWDCDGVDTPGLFRTSDAFAYLSNANRSQIADIRFFFGNPSDVPLAGDWDGDGCDTLSIYRPGEQRFFVINQLGQNEGGLGAAEFDFVFGNPGDKPVVGDWDADGVDEVGLHRESTGFFYWRETLTTGIADGTMFFGDPNDRFVAGDWGIVDGADTPAIFRPSNATFFFRHTLTQGVADSQVPFGQAAWLPVAGEFGLG